MSALLSRDQFLERAFLKHGDAFDYSQVEYVKAKVPVRIRCFKHGIFKQTPDKHLQSKYGCMKCWHEAQSAIKLAAGFSADQARPKVTVEEYLERLALPSHLSIDMSRYDGVTAGVVTVRCSLHGDFDYVPNFLLRVKSRCPKCGHARIAQSKTQSFDNFMEKVQVIHGSKYDVPYPEEYETRKSKLTVYCTNHDNIFTKSGQKLLLGQGCGICKKEELIADGTLSGGYNETLFRESPDMAVAPATVYYLKVGPWYKVGITRNKLNGRLRHIKHETKEQPEVLDALGLPLREAFLLEQAILKDFHRVRTYAIWSTEVFTENVLSGSSLAEYAALMRENRAMALS